MKQTHYRVSASSDSLANRGPSPGLQSWVSAANQRTFIAIAMNPHLKLWGGLRLNRPTTSLRNYRHAVGEELNAAGDQALARLKAIQHHVVVSHQIAKLDNLLPRNRLLSLSFGYKREGFSTKT